MRKPLVVLAALSIGFGVLPLPVARAQTDANQRALNDEYEGTVAATGEADDDDSDSIPPATATPVPEAARGAGQIPIRRLDERRADGRVIAHIAGRPLIFGGEYEGVLQAQHNFGLADLDDDRLRLKNELSLDLLYPFLENAAVFASIKALADPELYAEDGDRKSEESLEFDEAWLYIDGILDGHGAIQVGRQNFAEKRTWWWDTELDALRLYYDHERWHFELAAAEPLARDTTAETAIDPKHEDIFRVLGRASWEWTGRQSLEAYGLYQHDHSLTPGVGVQVSKREGEDDSDADLLWFGLRALGSVKTGRAGRFDYWADGALVRGNEERLRFDADSAEVRVKERVHRRVRGWALDVGASWTVPLRFDPVITLGFAQGSGDGDPDDGVDHAFRQTGLQDNKGKFRGVNRFHYYGALLQPELANLRIATFAVGVPLLDDSSVEVVYHRYRQDEAVPFLRDARIRAEPNGVNADIGQEWDIVFGFEEWKHLQLELVGALFEAGDAFGELAGKRSTEIQFQVNYQF
ncbi:MAG: alginate export family protein [Gammaproteobacteria bacterium]